MEKTVSQQACAVSNSNIDKLIRLLQVAKEEGMELESMPALSFQEYQFPKIEEGEYQF